MSLDLLLKLSPPAQAEKCRVSGENGVGLCHPPHILSHTPTDQFVHCEAPVTEPAAGQMSLHMDKARERRQLKSH